MSSLVSPVEEGCGHTGVSSAKDHKDDEEIGDLYTRRELEMFSLEKGRLHLQKVTLSMCD